MELKEYKYLPQERQDKIKALELRKLKIEFESFRTPITEKTAKELSQITRELRTEYQKTKVEPIFGDDILAKEHDWEVVRTIDGVFITDPVIKKQIKR